MIAHFFGKLYHIVVGRPTRARVEDGLCRYKTDNVPLPLSSNTGYIHIIFNIPLHPKRIHGNKDKYNS